MVSPVAIRTKPEFPDATVPEENSKAPESPDSADEPEAIVTVPDEPLEVVPVDSNNRPELPADATFPEDT